MLIIERNGSRYAVGTRGGWKHLSGPPVDDDELPSVQGAAMANPAAYLNWRQERLGTWAVESYAEDAEPGDGVLPADAVP